MRGFRARLGRGVEDQGRVELETVQTHVSYKEKLSGKKGMGKLFEQGVWGLNSMLTLINPVSTSPAINEG